MVKAPSYPGCTLNGTNTGTCCTVFPVTFNDGLTTCQTSADRVKALQSCLSALNTTQSNELACNSSALGSNSVNGKLVLLAVAVTLAVTVLAQA